MLGQATTTLVVETRGRGLGTRQGIYLWEHRLRPHRREVAAHLLGE